MKKLLLILPIVLFSFSASAECADEHQLKNLVSYLSAMNSQVFTNKIFLSAISDNQNIKTAALIINSGNSNNGYFYLFDAEDCLIETTVKNTDSVIKSHMKKLGK